MMKQQQSSLNNNKNNQNYSRSIPDEKNELMTNTVQDDTEKIIAQNDNVTETSLLLGNGTKKQQHKVKTNLTGLVLGSCCRLPTTATSPILCDNKFDVKSQFIRQRKWLILLFSMILIIILIGFVIWYTNIKNDEYDESSYKTLLTSTNNVTSTTMNDNHKITQNDYVTTQPINLSPISNKNSLDGFGKNAPINETNDLTHVETNNTKMTPANNITNPVLISNTTVPNVSSIDSNCNNNGFWWGKKGIGFIGQYDRVLALNVDWYYNWGLQRTYPNNQQQEKEYNTKTIWTNKLPMFLPMAWDGGISNNELEERIKNVIKNDWQNTSIYLTPIASIVFGFNEPDHTDQASMSINDGIERWNVLQRTIHQYNTTYQLVSPSCAFPSGQWMKSFMTIETNNTTTDNNTNTTPNVPTMNTIDYIGVHYYGTADFLSFQITIEGYYNEYNQIPIVITEFAPADWDAITIQDNKYTESDVLYFAQQALAWLDTTDWIIGYSWFSFDRNNPIGWTSALFYNNDNDDDNEIQLTPLGEFYKNFTSSRNSKCNHHHQ